MKRFFLNLLGRCSLCRRKKADRKYFNDKGKKILVCYHCVLYAERRAFRKVL